MKDNTETKPVLDNTPVGGPTFTYSGHVAGSETWDTAHQRAYCDDFILGRLQRTDLAFHFASPDWAWKREEAADLEENSLWLVDGGQRLHALRRLRLGEIPPLGLSWRDLEYTPWDSWLVMVNLSRAGSRTTIHNCQKKAEALELYHRLNTRRPARLQQG
jgi:hypothetical protein